MKQTSFMNFNMVPLSILFSMIAACADTGTSPVDIEQLHKWESMGIHDYVIQQQRQCFCVDGGRIVEVVIRADTVFSITAVDTLPYPLQSSEYLSIAGLFDYIEASRMIPSARVEVIYNAQYGYPERVFVDYLPNAVDDEVAYVTSSFLPIR